MQERDLDPAETPPSASLQGLTSGKLSDANIETKGDGLSKVMHAHKAGVEAARDSESKKSPDAVRGSKLKGIKQDSWGGGVRKALEVGRKDARHIPGVKADSWPFAPGSFNIQRKRHLPGVNENSWTIVPDMYGPVKGREAKKLFGGCFVSGGKGKLHCDSASGLHLGSSMSKLLGFRDRKRIVKADAGGDYGVNLLQEMKDQDLDAAAEAFGAAPSSPKNSYPQKLLKTKSHVLKARTQNLEQIGRQCSTLLDCFSTFGNLVPHHTHPSIA
eukprot:761404-Hanusia_phi.AAC.3